MPKMIGVSVDWDFFFKEDPLADWGHREAQFFIDPLIWRMRFEEHRLHSQNGKDLDESYVPNLLYRTFWSRLERHGFDFSHTIALYGDSHLGAYYAFHILRGTHRQVYNFDAHHDVAYGALGNVVDCGNWLGHLLKKYRSMEAKVVYPSVKRKAEEFGFHLTGETGKMLGSWLLSKRLSSVSLDTLPVQGREVNVVYICRSGCWTPPWADEQFIQFVRSFPGRALPLKDAFPGAVDLGDPMVVREFDREVAIRQAEITRAGLATLQKRMEESKNV